jgi:hypothetical protein
MNELDLQNRVIKVVRAARGSAAHKLSHRFLVGVPDLMVKIPRYPIMILEVKKDERPKMKSSVTLDVTVPQKRFLLQWAEAGVMCGVMSFLTQDRPRRLWVQTMPIRRLVQWELRMGVDAYTQLDDDQFLLTVIHNFGEHYQ